MLLRGEGPVVQELAAQGKLPPGRVMSFAKPGDDGPIIFRDVYINDAPPDMRHHMTKRPTQDDVARRTGTQVKIVIFRSLIVMICWHRTIVIRLVTQNVGNATQDELHGL